LLSLKQLQHLMLGLFFKTNYLFLPIFFQDFKAIIIKLIISNKIS